MTPAPAPEGLWYGYIDNFVISPTGREIEVQWQYRQPDKMVLQDDGTFVYQPFAPNKLDVSSVIDRHMNNAAIYNLCFDKLDAFTTNSSKMHIINLTATDIPEPFMNWVNGIRSDLVANGCLMQSGFRLHVTLGRVDSSAIKIDRLQGIIENFKMPSFVLPLRSFDYRKFRGDTIKRWEINDNQQ